jgi:signal peptidase I
VATTLEEEREQPRGAGETPDDRPGASRPPRGLLREYFESAAVVLVMAVFFMTFVAQAAEVPSASMENTVYVGDRFLINKFIFAPGPVLPFLPQREIRRGDIVVFKYPAESAPSEKIVQFKTLFIKRVVGLPGETVEVRGPNVYVDGKLLPEYRIEARDPLRGNDKAELKDLHTAAGTEGPYKVFYTPETLTKGETVPVPQDAVYAVRRSFRIPEGHYFMMGDNRDNSRDSRFWGPVARDLIIGRAMFVIWSSDLSRPQQPGVSGFVSDFFNNTRWGRIGTLLR